VLIPDSDAKDAKSQYRIGIASNPTHVDQLPFDDAFRRSVEQNKSYSLLIFQLVHKMLERKVSMNQMESPIRISQVTGEAVKHREWIALMEIIAAISLNLGIFNLFPIPILDGGLILLLCIEGLMRRDISQPIKERIYQAAFVCLIVFAGVVIFNDVMKEIAGFARHAQ
jgi:regulator of sigma E protease